MCLKDAPKGEAAGEAHVQKNPKRQNTAALQKARALSWVCACAILCGQAGGASLCRVIVPGSPSELELLGAREVRRYLYLRTGELVSVQRTDELADLTNRIIVVARRDRSLAIDLATASGFETELASLAAGQFLLRSDTNTNSWRLLLSGGDDVGTLYAAYRFAEHIGARFYLHGDVVPDQQVDVPDSPAQEAILPGVLDVTALDEVGRPLFPLRGTLPFHDFSEGPDWWNRDDYLAILSQLPKLRMNFFGLHTYPEDDPAAEPTTWIGLGQDLGQGAEVNWSYPASYQNTLRAKWGHVGLGTSNFVYGSAQLFDFDAYGGDVMRGLCPGPTNQAQGNELFARTGRLFQEAFRYAHSLGIKIAIGNHTPLVVPREVKSRLISLGLNPNDPAVVQALYEGVFTRLMQIGSVDYYWLWTTEWWAWNGASSGQISAVTNDLPPAIAAARQVDPPFQLAMSGWVLGPPTDPTLFDRIIPKEMPMSTLNRNVGAVPVDLNFALIQQRSKWAISWLEDDSDMTMPQLWSSRLRRDAADALRYGCDGLIGLHWRTRMVGPGVSALAQSAWDQSPWNPNPNEPGTIMPIAGPVDGLWARSTSNITCTTNPVIYQTVRYIVSAYWLPVSNGPCRVTLRFCESWCSAPGQRVFDVKLQGQTVISNLDIFARVGPNCALDQTFDSVSVSNGWVLIQFVPRLGSTAIAAIDVEGPGFSWKINCGDLGYGEYSADWPASLPNGLLPPISDFYADWAEKQFGPEVAIQAASLFSQIDSALPRPATWDNGPGGLFPDSRSWDTVRPRYAFVDTMLALQPLVQRAGNRERFDYWLNNFLYLRTAAQLNCAWAQFNLAMNAVRAAPDPTTAAQLAQERALPLRRQMVDLVRQAFQYLLATVSTTGEMGTVANWNQHILPVLLTAPGEELASYLGQPLPADAQPSPDYNGPTRLIVPTVRNTLGAGEVLNLKPIILAETPPLNATLNWRVLGQGAFQEVALQPVARGVYSVRLPVVAQPGLDLEYFIQVTPTTGAPLFFPATAPAINQTVVVSGLTSAPRLLTTVLPNGQVQILLDGNPGTTCVLESSTRLANWLPLATNAVPTSGQLSFPISSSAGPTFYRARQQ